MKKQKKEGVIPKIKKKVNAFLVGEEGKISKETILKAGAIAGGFALSSALLSKGVYSQHNQHSNNGPIHSNGLSLNYDAPSSSATSTHTSHGNHTNAHSNHASHGSHCSGGVARW